LPDPRHLRVGDLVRILRVPDGDRMQRDNEIASGADMAGWTADSIERVIAQTPVVQISRIAEYGCVWYDATIIGPGGAEEVHSLIIYNDDTWELIRNADG